MSVLGGRRDPDEEAALEKAADELHANLLNLVLPGYPTTPESRRRARLRATRRLRSVGRDEGTRGRG